MSFIIGANSAVAGGFDVDNSCNFELGSLHKSVSTPSTTFTISVWVKLSNQYVAASSIGQRYFWTGGGAGGASGAKWNSGNTGYLDFYNEGTGHVDDGTDRNYRDPSAWYHWVWKNAGGTGTLYVNGVQQGATFSMGPLIGSGGPAVINIGRYGADTVYAPMTMAEFVYLDGTGATPTSFGEFDEDSGVWKPIDVSGLTFGTNGFHLDFSNSSALGTDANGGTALTKTATLSQLTDSPTNNFATLNPLEYSGGGKTFTIGNCKQFLTGVANFTRSTIGVASGKWYCEVKLIAGLRAMYGISSYLSNAASNYLGELGNTTVGYSYGIIGNTGRLYHAGGSTATWVSTVAADDIVMLAMDLDNYKIYFGKNGTWERSGDPTSGATGTGAYTIIAPSLNGTGFYQFAFGCNSTSEDNDSEMNFGNPAFTVSSGNADGDGYGNFEYAVPSGYFSLCSKNLAEYG